MGGSGLGDVFKEIEEKISTPSKEAILDISVFPELNKIVEVSRFDFKPVYYIPDTVYKLFIKAKTDVQYYQLITDLFRKWTTRSIDFRLLSRISHEKEIGGIRFVPITKEMVDMEVYEFCYERFVDEKLFAELSPRTNVLGDIIGKILGFAKRSKIPILMLNRKLATMVRGVIPVFDATNIFVDKKQKFFSAFIPVKRTRGVRWFICLVINLTLPSNPAGVVLAVVDP